MANLGYVGLGEMGGLMVKRLMEKGHTVTGHNRTKSKAQWLIDLGMVWADSPREVCEASDMTLSMVSDSKAVTEIAEGPDGLLAGLSPGKILIEMSTIKPGVSVAIAERAREKGGDMVDVPVSGSQQTLRDGKLSMMVGGRPETFEKIKPVLADIGPRTTYIGENGRALAMKLAANISVAVQILAFSEGVLLAEKSGVDRKTAVDVLTHSVVGSALVQYRGPFVLEMPEQAWFNVNMMQKDLLLALELGREVDTVLPTASIANDLMTVSRGMGFADQDFAVVFKTLERMSGVTE
jgi:3-hydroxyisobutyrate dehydrogenase-like beta-hydroxyacid dehydrogenase